MGRVHLSAGEDEWCLRGEVCATDGEGGVARGQVVCREGRGCRVELLKGGTRAPY